MWACHTHSLGVRQMQQPETVKDELRVFLGQHPNFKEIEDYLPTQRGQVSGRLPARAKRAPEASPGGAGRDALQFRDYCPALPCYRHRQDGDRRHGCQAVWQVNTIPGPHGGAGGSGHRPSGSCGPGPRWAAMWRA